jgi:asparagine synthase (glutamine-hydrolysing)
MSGICGLVHLDGSPVDPGVVQDLSDAMRYRGPDGIDVRVHGEVGFGHTLFDVSAPGAKRGIEGSSDQAWVVADARIDGRLALVEKLRERGRIFDARANDAELILASYEVWGNECVRHLIGDFAFAVWDRRKRTLFCARDHFGVKPFFFAQFGSIIVFANTISSIRRHPALRHGRVDEAWIGDFLLFEESQDSSATCYAGIRRLPPAHFVEFGAATRCCAFWRPVATISVDDRRPHEVIERFTELLRDAVKDRLPDSDFGIELSGGLDSTSVASIAKTLTEDARSPHTMRALTIVHNDVKSDKEGRLAALVGDRLGMPINYLVADGFDLLDFAKCKALRFDEPTSGLFPSKVEAATMLGASLGRVVLTGWDGDAILSDAAQPFLRHLWQHRNWREFLSRVSQSRRSGAYVLRRLRSQIRPRSAEPESCLPAWLSPDFVKRLDLASKWDSARGRPHGGGDDRLRPEAVRSLMALQRWSNFFDADDAGASGVNVEYRHPLLDVRLVEFCLSLPPIPWCMEKALLRRAMKGKLPNPILARAKSPLGNQPIMLASRRAPVTEVDEFIGHPALDNFVERLKVPPLVSQKFPVGLMINSRPFRLNAWLAQHMRV